MARILIIHPTLMAKGGGELVCMNVLEALQEKHDVDLLTVSDPDFTDLNKYYATSVTNINIRLIDGLSAISHRLPKNRFGKLKMAFLESYIINNNLGDKYDLLFSTYNELRVPCKSIQYIHFPYTDRNVHPNADDFSTSIYSAYDWVCDVVGPSLQGNKENTEYLSNSDWTGDKVDKALGVNSRTVYPPVDTSDFDPLDWESRENGFVTVGRISPEKNILRNINIISKLHKRNDDVHYHIIGPKMDRYSSPFSESYCDKVMRKCEKYEFIHHEGEVSRDRLIELISTHKYGLHGMDHEHFGIAVAELIAGGTIPFVPQGGGQQEVVGHCDDVMYDSVDDAVQKIESILRSEEKQKSVQQKLPNIDENFGRSRFQYEIKQITDEVVS
ncbi:glycosyltransferase family 4 protein [Natrinema gari]|nr:glycosyltransferase [Natrinema gari]